MNGSSSSRRTVSSMAIILQHCSVKGLALWLLFVGVNETKWRRRAVAGG
jgi:hypothetical protein